jgi:hypothetical protein
VTVIDDRRTFAMTRPTVCDPAPPRQTPDELAGRVGWERPALLALLTLTAAAYLWALGSSGWANDFYAAAVQAGTQDWKAWLFGSLDPGNSHYRRQAARRAVGDGAVSQAVGGSAIGRCCCRRR